MNAEVGEERKEGKESETEATREEGEGDMAPTGPLSVSEQAAIQQTVEWAVGLRREMERESMELTMTGKGRDSSDCSFDFGCAQQ